MPRGYRKAPPKQLSTGLLPVPRVGGVPVKTLVEAIGGPKAAAACLRISDELMAKWITEELEAPFSAKVALFWQSRFGMEAAFSESHWSHQYNTFLKNEARARVAVLEEAIKAARLPLPAGRLTTPAEMLLAGPDPLEPLTAIEGKPVRGVNPLHATHEAQLSPPQST